jgi:diguanylate cyclase (GGDEF)-like protein
MDPKISVLHVEDNRGDARLMKEYLRDAGPVEFDVAVIGRLDEALRCLESVRFDVILLDLSLPDAQGLDAVRRLCDSVPDYPIVVLTGLDDESLAIRAVQAGAEDYLIKGRLDGASCVRALRYAIERHRGRRELRSQSLRDDMTGLYNRRGFLALADQHLKLADREHTDLWLLFCDLDDLKEVNDTFGHYEGDRAIVSAARILRDTLRDTDLVARIGGDEFTVLFLDGSGKAAAQVVARLEESLEAHTRPSGRPWRLSMCMGVARRDPRSGRSLAEMLAEADRALYEQKRRRHSARVPQAATGTHARI